MVDGILGGDAVLGTVGQEAVEKVDAVVVQVVQDVLGVVRSDPSGEGGIPVLELGASGPYVLGGGPELAEDLVELVDLGIAGEQGALGHHLDEDGADGPHVDGGGVGLRSEEDFGRAVPQGNDLVGEGSDGGAEGPGQTKVGQLEASVAGNEEVLRLEVAVHDAPGVAEGQSADALEEVGLDEVRGEHAVDGFHVLLQVLVEELEDEVELAVGLDAVLELDDVVVLELAEEADLPQGRGGDALVLDLETDALQGDDFIVGPVPGLVDHTVRALAEVGAWLFDFLVAVSGGEERSGDNVGV